nr:ATP-binding protein [Eubacterium sp.]
EIATDYGFDKNLWHDYIAYTLVTNENPFSLTAERAGTVEGSVNNFAREDMRIFNHLYNYDFQKIERTLDIDCFSTITDYKSVHKRHQVYNRSVSQKVRDVSDSIEAINYVFEEEKKFPQNFKDKSADDVAAEMLLDLVKEFYKAYGVGMLGLNAAFRIAEVAPQANIEVKTKKGIDFQIGRGISCTPVKNTDKKKLDDLVGYEIQKTRLRENTESFIAGNPANNVLLFGDAGTGKSTSIKALINEYYDDGLRMIELYKHQMKLLAPLISSIKNRNYRFIIYMDDLSFEEDETEYKYLKAVIEGGLETRPDNVLIYATSNRRNLIRETWNDTNDVELDKHRSDTLQEKLSLVSRFGVTIPYMRPNKKEYEEIVRTLASSKVDITEEELMELANKWSVSHGGMSGRAAQQLIDSLS